MAPGMNGVAVGSRIGEHFVVEAELGAGGMGAVYRVRDDRSGRVLALKRLTVRDAALVSLFEHEFHTLAELAHPRIIAVYDYGVDADGAWYTMELLDGADLSERGALGWEEACSILRDVASSLAILHSRRLLHRDVSLRNVRSTADGRAKLIDFGALCTLGVQRKLIGTPPFLPPEALQQQSLDGRSDLFALGGVAYWMLTGRHAYPARALTQLPDVWRRAPEAPRALVPDIPDALSRLVLQLLSLDPAARPNSAAEVMDRLCGIAGLPAEEHADISQAYLATPVLLGRETALAAAHEMLARSVRGQGGALLIQGAAGAGRSRMLDACVLEARLLGATVLRADAGDSGDFGAARALASQLFDAHPALARRVARRFVDTLSAVLPELASERAPGRPLPERRHLQVAFRDWLLIAARRQPLLIAVDDVESIDEPSRALLAALAHRSERRRVCLIATTRPEASDPALVLLREVATTLALEPLAAEQSEALLRSVFGEAQGIAGVAARLHTLAEGLPRALMDLARHLVERGVARYESGGWHLPTRIEASDLPRSLVDERLARLAELSEDARVLAECLALTEPALIARSDYAELCGHADRARCARALGELVAAGILHLAGEHCRFAQPHWAALLARQVEPSRGRVLHTRLAETLHARAQVLPTAQHWFEAGEERRAVELLDAQLAAEQAMAVDLPVVATRLYERAVQASQQLELPPLVRTRLKIALAGSGCLVGAHETIRRPILDVASELARACGLAAWHELDDAPPGDRLKLALVGAQQRWQETPEAQRGHAPADALKLLARICAIAASTANAAADLELLEALPSLAPFAVLSPALGAIEQIVVSTRDALAGRGARARAGFTRTLERLEQPDRAGLEEGLQEGATRGLSFALGNLDATLGRVHALEWSERLQEIPGHRANAWRVRMTYELVHGRIDAGYECRRRAELLELQDDAFTRYPGSALRAHAVAQTLAEDLEGLKQSVPRLEAHGRVYPRTAPDLALARAEYLRLKGSLSEALACVEAALEQAPVGRSRDWARLAACRVRALDDLGRSGDAADVGLAALDACREREVDAYALYPAVLEALVRCERLEDASVLADEGRALYDSAEVDGLERLRLEEALARHALARGAPEAFHRAALRIAEHCRLGHAAPLRARYERLLAEADRRGVPVRGDLRLSEEGARGPGASASVAERLRACADALERARCALCVLLECTGATGGYLYRLRGGDLELLARRAEQDAPASLVGVLERLVLEERAQHDVTGTLSLSFAQTVNPASDFEQDGDFLRPHLLLAQRAGQTVVAGVAALRYAEAPRRLPDWGRLNELANALLESAQPGA